MPPLLGVALAATAAVGGEACGGATAVGEAFLTRNASSFSAPAAAAGIVLSTSAAAVIGLRVGSCGVTSDSAATFVVEMETPSAESPSPADCTPKGLAVGPAFGPLEGLAPARSIVDSAAAVTEMVAD